MDPAVAALIGAGAAAALVSQFLNHGLSAKRDRRNERRERLNKVIVEGISLSQIHFGHDHPLVEKYSDACATCYEAEVKWLKHLRSSQDEERISEHFSSETR